MTILRERTLVWPTPQYEKLAGIMWKTVPLAVQIEQEGKTAKECAMKLMRHFNLKPGSKQEVPTPVMGCKALHHKVKEAMRYMLQRGYWNPCVLPLDTDGVREGFEREIKMYSRMIPFEYRKPAGTFGLLTDDLEGWTCVSPRDINQKTEMDYPEHDRCIFHLFKGAKEALTGPKDTRIPVNTGSVGQPVFIYEEGMTLNTEWVKTTKAKPERLVGTRVPRSALAQESLEEAFVEFKWFAKLACAVLQLNHPDKIHPKLLISPDDFPASDQEKNAMFFKGWREPARE